MVMDDRRMLELAARITGYLSGGGLFNPELANHDAVRDLLIDCRDTVAAAAIGEQMEKEQQHGT